MNKLKVLLTNAPALDLNEFDISYNKIRGYSLYPPVSLTTIAAAALKQIDNIEIDILDLEFEIRKYFLQNCETRLSAEEVMRKKIVDKLKTFQPALVGISVVYSISNSNAFTIANIIKSENPEVTVVCGGNHITFVYDQALKNCPSIDFIFLYEADHTFPEFLEYLNGKKELRDLKGIVYLDKTTNEVQLAPRGPAIEDLDQLPIPRWEGVPLKKYQLYGRIGSINNVGDVNKPSYVMQTVRGCMAGCRFCTVRNFYGEVRAYSPKRVLAEIDYFYNELGITQLEILDDDFTFNRNRTLQICDGLVKRNYSLVWYLANGIRLGTIDEEIMDKLIRAGCQLISIGVESGNDRILRAIRKPLSLKMLYEKVEIIRKYPQMYVKGNYIVGFPSESEEETMNTFRVAEEIGFDWNLFSVCNYFPGTSFFQGLDEDEQKGFDFDASRFDFQMDKVCNQHRVTAMSTEDFCEMAYFKNLEINFIKNRNLKGRNIDRAIRDFEGIVTFIAPNHAIAHYYLAKAYYKKGNNKLSREYLQKAIAIIADSKNYKWAEYFDKLISQKELGELKAALCVQESTPAQ